MKKENFLALVANLNEFRLMVRGIVLRSLAITIFFGAAAFMQANPNVTLQDNILIISSSSVDIEDIDGGGSIIYDLEK